MSERGWDKATEERLAEEARCLEQQREAQCCELAADIRAVLAEIERRRDNATYWRTEHDLMQAAARTHLERAESAERDAQQQRERADRLEAALREIAAIPNRYLGGDWDEIEQARKIAGAALAAQPAGK